jgi:hypothetical protein
MKMAEVFSITAEFSIRNLAMADQAHNARVLPAGLILSDVE